MNEAPRTRLVGVLCLFAASMAWLRHQTNGLPGKGFILDLGYTTGPSPLFERFASSYAIWGTTGVLAAALAIAFLAGPRLYARIPRVSPRVVAVASVGAALFAILLRHFVFRDMAITDDESAYQLSSEILASGHVLGTSPPNPLFFDRVFVINDGRLFSQYFLGWPALMVPGVWLGLPGYVNAVLFGATVPAVAIVLRSLVTPRWVTVGLVLFATAPLLFFNAATQLSHLSAVFMLAWAHASYVLSRKQPSALWWHALFALCLAGGVWVRPLPAVTMGLPLGLAWALAAFKSPARVRALVAFMVPALILGAGFLAVNKLQTGSYTNTAYRYAFQFSEANLHRFSLWMVGYVMDTPNMAIGDWHVIKRTGEGAAKMLAPDMFGWPVSYIFLPVAVVAAVFVRAARLPLAMLFVYMAAHVQLLHVGVDTFGPVHFSECAYPMVLLTVIGARWLGLWIGTRAARFPELRFVPLALVVASIAACLVVYLPVRGLAISQITADVRVPYDVAASAGAHHAVVFSPRPFTPRCRADGSAPPHHFAYWRPNNDPALENDILWVNHLSIERDKDFMRKFPGRTGYWLAYGRNCTPYFVPLAEVGPGMLPNGPVRMFPPHGSVPSMFEVYREPERLADGSFAPILHPVRVGNKLVLKP